MMQQKKLNIINQSTIMDAFLVIAELKSTSGILILLIDV